MLEMSSDGPYWGFYLVAKETGENISPSLIETLNYSALPCKLIILEHEIVSTKRRDPKKNKRLNNKGSWSLRS